MEPIVATAGCGAEPPISPDSGVLPRPPLSAIQVQAAGDFFRGYVEDRRRGKPFGILPPELTPSTLAEALDIARSLWGDTAVAGWKAGACSVKTMKKLGFAHVPYARLAREHLVQSPAQLPTETFWHCNNEAEVAFTLASSLPPRTESPYTLEEVTAAIDKAFIAIEACNWPHPIADEEWEGGPRAVMLGCIASGFHVHSLVIGPEIKDWKLRDLGALPVELVINGTVFSRGQVGESRIDPLSTLVGMVNHMSARGCGLEAGQIVTTGSAVECGVTNNKGDVAIARFFGIGEVSVSYT